MAAAAAALVGATGRGGVLRASGVGTLLFDLLTEDEEAVDAYTRICGSTLVY